MLREQVEGGDVRLASREVLPSRGRVERVGGGDRRGEEVRLATHPSGDRGPDARDHLDGAPLAVDDRDGGVRPRDKRGELLAQHVVARAQDGRRGGGARRPRSGNERALDRLGDGGPQEVSERGPNEHLAGVPGRRELLRSVALVERLRNGLAAESAADLVGELPVDDGEVALVVAQRDGAAAPGDDRHLRGRGEHALEVLHRADRDRVGLAPAGGLGSEDDDGDVGLGRGQPRSEQGRVDLGRVSRTLEQKKTGHGGLPSSACWCCRLMMQTLKLL